MIHCAPPLGRVCNEPIRSSYTDKQGSPSFTIISIVSALGCQSAIISSADMSEQGCEECHLREHVAWDRLPEIQSPLILNQSSKSNESRQIQDTSHSVNGYCVSRVVLRETSSYVKCARVQYYCSRAHFYICGERSSCWLAKKHLAFGL